MLGGEAEVPTLTGKPLRLKIPPTTQNGQVLRLKGQGMPSTSKSGERGDLYATVEVQLPKTLTPKQREHYEALAQMHRERRPGMNLNKYTEKAQEAIIAAQQLAEKANHPQIEPEHLLVALIDQRGGVVPDVLRKMNVDPAVALSAVQSALASQSEGLRRRAAESRRASARSPTPPRKKRRACRMNTSAPSTCWSRSPRSPAARPPRRRLHAARHHA